MKYFVFLFLLICNTIYSQTEAHTLTMLTFELHYPPMGDNDIDWDREKPKCEFILNGKTPLKYSMALENDTIASLSRYENEQWILQEDMQYQSYFLYREENELFSHFRIADFDKDGDEDLLCWIFSNINGNEWTIVFLNDQKNKKLIRLIDTTENTDIWDRPEYDEKTKVINCTLDGSAFGVSAESTFILDDLTAIPLKRHYQDRLHSRHIVDYYYVGESGKWKLVKKKKLQ